MSEKPVSCISGGPDSAQRAFEVLNKRLNKDRVGHVGSFDFVKRRSFYFFGDEIITVYMGHDVGYDRVFRFVRDSTFHSPGYWSVKFYAQTQRRDRGQSVWVDFDVFSDMCSNDGNLTAMELSWYSILMLLNIPDMPKSTRGPILHY